MDDFNFNSLKARAKYPFVTRNEGHTCMKPIYNYHSTGIHLFFTRLRTPNYDILIIYLVIIFFRVIQVPFLKAQEFAGLLEILKMK